MNLVKIKSENVNITNKIYDFNDPKNIYLPITSEQTFRVNDYIYKNQKIDNLYSSISGVIKSIKKVLYNNKLVTAIEIENDYKENSQTKRKANKIKNKEELLKELDFFNLDNIKNKIKDINNISNLVITVVDEEEYSASETISFTNNYMEILETIDNISKILNINNVFLAIKNTNYSSIKKINSNIGMYPSIKLELLPDLYLISHKEFLCNELKIDINDTISFNMFEMYEIYTSIIKHRYINERLITISGNAIKKGSIINVKLYTSLSEILEEFISFNTELYDIYINGFINGFKYNNKDEIIITEYIHTIVINKKEKKEVMPCINCGACRRICPYNINAKNCYFYKYKHRNCINCGLCNFICPSNIDIKSVIGGNNE